MSDHVSPIRRGGGRGRGTDERSSPEQRVKPGLGGFSGAQGVGYGYDARCEVLGQKGIITAGAWPAPGMAKSWQTLFADAYLAEDEDFVRCILEDREPRVTGLDGKRAVEVVNAGNESIRTGRLVKLL